MLREALENLITRLPSAKLDQLDTFRIVSPLETFDIRVEQGTIRIDAARDDMATCVFLLDDKGAAHAEMLARSISEEQLRAAHAQFDVSMFESLNHADIRHKLTQNPLSGCLRIEDETGNDNGSLTFSFFSRDPVELPLFELYAPIAVFEDVITKKLPFSGVFADTRVKLRGDYAQAMMLIMDLEPAKR